MFVLLFIALSASQFIPFISLFFTFNVMFSVCFLFTVYVQYNMLRNRKIWDLFPVIVDSLRAVSILEIFIYTVIRFIPVPVHILFSGAHATPVFLFLRITVFLLCSKSSDWSVRCSAGFRLFYP